MAFYPDMTSEEIRILDSKLGAIRTTRQLPGTQLRRSYSATELGTLSGEVVLNFRRQEQAKEQEDHVSLPLGGNPPRLPFTRDRSEPRKAVRSARMDMVSKMLASVGTLRSAIMQEMATLNRGSCRETSRDTEVQDSVWVNTRFRWGESELTQ